MRYCADDQAVTTLSLTETLINYWEQAICVVGGRDGVLTGYAAPCGVCRQVMMEFCDPETFQIILAVSKDKYDVFTLRELFPLGFGPADLA